MPAADDRRKLLAALTTWLDAPPTLPVRRVLEGKRPGHEQPAYFMEVPRLIIGLEGRGTFLTVENDQEVVFNLAAGFAIMPATDLLPDDSWLSAICVKDPAGSWIDAWRSTDRGAHWQPAGRPVPDAGGTSGNPPHLIRLRDGRLCLTYGYRSPPFGIRARLSSDDGRTWKPEIVLRADVVTHDWGYPRSAERSDGRIVIEHDGALFVAFATAKSTVEALNIRVADLAGLTQAQRAKGAR